MKLQKDFMRVENLEKLPAKIDCERIRVGGLNAYKPDIVKLSTGELIMANSHRHCEKQGDGRMCIHTMLFRSHDNGKSWQGRHFTDIIGHEPYLSIFKNDTLIITTHLLECDVLNQTGKCLAILHRSEDKGLTWKRTFIDESIIPNKSRQTTVSSRNIIELDDETLLMGITCRQGKDYVLKSFDMGKTWKAFPCVIEGYEQESYIYSALEEAVFWKTKTGRLLMLSRCGPEFMKFTQNIPDLPDFDYSKATGSDHFMIEILFESEDKGITWKPIKGVKMMSIMYPSVLHLRDGRTLLTFTVREPLESRHMGVQAVFIREEKNGDIIFETEKDRIVIDEKTPDYLQSGGGFGNTIQLDDGTLLTPYSYYFADEDIIKEMKDGSYFSDERKFEKIRLEAAKHYEWAKGFNYRSLKKKNERLRVHCYLGCWEVLRKAGTIVEVVRWRLPKDKG